MMGLGKILTRVNRTFCSNHTPRNRNEEYSQGSRTLYYSALPRIACLLVRPA